MVGRELAERLHLARRHEVGEEERGRHSEEQAYSSRQGETGIEVFDVLLEQFGLVYHLLQCHHGEQGYGELGNDQYRRHGAELGIHREMVDEEVGKGHEVLSP